MMFHSSKPNLIHRLCKSCGFTLLEVLAALAIASTGLLAVSQTISSSIDVSSGTEARMIAYWVAGNHMSELRLSRLRPAAGNATVEARMARRDWLIQRVVTDTADPDVVSVELSISDKNNPSSRLASLKGYLVSIEQPKKVTPK